MTVLNRRMVTGPKTLTINPNTHICITNTMLCPIASFNMCNVAGITAGSNHFGSLCGVQWQPLGCGHARTNFCHSWYWNCPWQISQSRWDMCWLKYGAWHHQPHFYSVIPWIHRSENWHSQPFLAGYRSTLWYLWARNCNESNWRAHFGNMRGSRFWMMVTKNRRQIGLFHAMYRRWRDQPTIAIGWHLLLAGLQLEISKEQPLNTKLSCWLVSFVCVD